jgi:hypothetical protein
VETLVKKVIPAIADFTNNLGEKLRPVIQFLTPITDGLRSAFNSVRDSLSRNSDELKPLLILFKGLADFARDVLAPILSKTLGKAFEIVGAAVGALISGVASVVNFFDDLYNKIKRVIDISKQIGSALNPFNNASFPTGASSPAAPAAPAAPVMPNAPIAAYRYVGNQGTTNITVNGAIDSESTARQIVSILNDSSSRGTLGSAAFF